MATDYIDSKGLHHFIRDHDQIITRDKEYIEQVLGRKFNSEETKSMDTFITKRLTGADFDCDVVGIYGIKEEKEMNYNSKVITLVGSMSEVNKAAMMELYNRLTYKGNNVKLPYMERVPEDASDEQIKLLHDVHEAKMDSANLVIVVDADGHIGKDTQREINWCNDLGKNIIYLSDMQVYDGEVKQTKGGKRS